MWKTPAAVRLILRILIAVAANALALWLASVLLDGVVLDAGGFIFAVIIFSLLSLLLRPIIIWLVARWVRPLLGVVALVATFLILLVTDLLSDGIQIDGAGTWILATLIVWAATLIFELLDERILRGLGHGRPRTA
jgi:putative membrane protein